jgi:hypothetical protein
MSYNHPPTPTILAAFPSHILDKLQNPPAGVLKLRRILPTPPPPAIDADEVEIEFHNATVEHIQRANKIVEECNDEALKTWRMAEARKLWEQEEDEKELAWRNARRAEKAPMVEPRKFTGKTRRRNVKEGEERDSPRKR